MAWLERKANRQFHIGFRFAGQKFKKSLGTCERRTADARLLRVEENIRLVETGRLAIPDDVDVGTFLLSDGQLNGSARRQVRQLSFKQARQNFLDSIPDGSLEKSTLAGMQTHLDHLQRVLGANTTLRALSLEDLQHYVEKRSKNKGIRGNRLSPATIKKELTTLRTLWNWACQAGYLERRFPSKGLRYPKTADKQPFQTWSEISRKIEAYELSAQEQLELWDALFLTTDEITELVEDVRQAARHRWIYPMFMFAAHTGARRSEILRSRVEDIDLAGRLLTIREKKRVRGRLTTRSVPLSSLLFKVLQKWLDAHPGRGYTFSLGHNLPPGKKPRSTSEPFPCDQAQDHFKRTLAGTKWSNVRGWHVFRHSFCSNCAAAGIDQRIINAWVGHQTEEMVKRYRHLVPSQQQEAIAKVFSAG